MTFVKAKKLNVGDKVVFKLTGDIVCVVRIDIEDKDVFIYCDDNRWYHHTALSGNKIE